MARERISVIIHTYNEEARLARTLRSVSAFDEVIVADMQSTDRTLEIARQFGCRILSFEKGDHVVPEPYRQQAIEMASGEWVFAVDADEVVPQALQAYLYKQIESGEAPDGIWIPRQNFFMGRSLHSGYPDYVLRFFRRSKAHWPTTIHSMPTIDGRVERIAQSRKDLALLHMADTSIATRLRKLDQYTEAELVRRGQRRFGVAALLGRPLWRFVKAYFIKRGFLDGKAGLIAAGLDGYYQFVMVAKAIEKRQTKDHDNASTTTKG